MTREEKAVVINSLVEQLNAYPHFYITNIEALNAEQTASCLLYTSPSPRDRTSVMFTETGKAPAVLIKEFRKTSDKPVLKAAYVEGCVYVGDNQLDTLCNIKSREELIGDIVSLLQSPAKNVISALQANAGQKIAGLVKALEERNN